MATLFQLHLNVAISLKKGDIIYMFLNAFYKQISRNIYKQSVNYTSHMHKPHLCFETLANDVRMQIIDLLKESPANVNELTERIRLERSRISHSLQMLRKCKFVNVKKQGREMIYSLNDKALAAHPTHKSIFNVIESHAKHFCSDGCHKLNKSNEREKRN